jgi:hypothetical protein
LANVLHSSLTGANLHEPKGVASATSGQVYVANGAGSGVWTTPAEVVFPNKHIAGLTYANAADATNDITVLAGTARDTTNTEDMTLGASITKRLDATWVVGDNQGGLDTGSIANTTYHIWLIKRTDTDVVDVLFSTSATSPTMPTNYTKKRRIGSFQRISGAIQAFDVNEIEGGGLHVALTGAFSTSSVSVTFAGGQSTLTKIPTGVRFDALIYVDTLGKTETLTLGHGGSSTGFTVSRADVPRDLNVNLKTNTSAQIYAKTTTNPGPENFSMGVLSWIDYRRD